MLDMSKVFNSINWSKQIEGLQSTIETELDIIFKLLNVSLSDVEIPWVKFLKLTLEHHKETVQAYLSLHNSLKP